MQMFGFQIPACYGNDVMETMLSRTDYGGGGVGR